MMLDGMNGVCTSVPGLDTMDWGSIWWIRSSKDGYGEGGTD